MRKCTYAAAILFLAGSALCRAASDTDVAAPPKPESSSRIITEEIRSGDPAKLDQAVSDLTNAAENHHISSGVWRTWLPGLMTQQRYQAVADISLDSISTRPVDGIVKLLALRVQALLDLNKPADALAAAKSYYNVCPLANTDDGVNLIGVCLAKLHPDDAEIVHRLRDEQATAAESPTTSPSDATASAATTRPSMISSIAIDASVYQWGLDHWSKRTIVFNDRVGYANLLLAADRGHDAEKVFRDLYQFAAKPADLTTAAEGIARALRAEDGNVGRANAWIMSLQQAAGADTAAGAENAAGADGGAKTVP